MYSERLLMMDRNCTKHVEFYSKNKFEKLVHLVGFIIRIYHDARSSECQKVPGVSPVGKCGRCVALTALTTSLCRLFRNSGSHKLLQPKGHVLACNGIASIGDCNRMTVVN